MGGDGGNIKKGASKTEDLESSAVEVDSALSWAAVGLPCHSLQGATVRSARIARSIKPRAGAATGNEKCHVRASRGAGNKQCVALVSVRQTISHVGGCCDADCTTMDEA